MRKIEKTTVSIALGIVFLLLLFSAGSCTRPPALIYDGNGHTAGEPPVSEVTTGEVETLIAERPGSLERIGYRFMGWNTERNGEGHLFQPGDTISVGSETTTLYADWAAGFYVYFDGNGQHGGYPSNRIFVSEGDGIDIPEFGDLNRQGYWPGCEIAYRPDADSDDVYRLITINDAGVCNDTGVVIRRGPGTSFDRVMYQPSMHVRPERYLPQGTGIYVYGHLKEPEEIGEWFNYWYLILLPMEAMNEGPVWVFGEFIDVEGVEAPNRS